MAKGLRKNDPYKNMGSGKEGIRPGFLGGSGDGNKKADDSGLTPKESASKDAADSLGAAEDAATEEGLSSQFGDGLGSVREDEEEAGGLYTGGGKSEKKSKGRFFGFLKKRGPATAIVGMFLGIGGMINGTQSIMPFAIQEMIIQKFNSIGISSTVASDAWLNTQLNQGVRLQNLKTGDTENLFAFSPYQVNEFKKHDIIVVSNIGGETTQITALLYKKGDLYIPVVGSDFLGDPNLLNAIKAASGLENIGTPISASEALADRDFKNPYTSASKGWRGGSSGWFDQIMSSITETKLSITRNRWARYIASGIKSANDSFVKVAANAEKLSKMKDNGVDNNETTVKGVDDEYYTGYEIHHDDESGADYIINDRGQRVDLDGEFNNNVETDLGSIGSWAKGVSSSEAYQKISGVLNSKAMKAGVKAAEIGCGLAEALVTIYTIASAYQSLQFLNLISGYLEAVDKVKAGDGSGSPIHNYNNNLTTKAETIDSNTGDGTGVSKTAMESQGMASLFSGKSPNSSDASVQNINFESLMSQMSVLTSGVEYTAKTFEACGYIKIATSAISLATTVISFIPIIGQGVKGAEVIVKALKRAAVSAAISIAIQIIIPIATRKIAELVIKNAATEWFGEDLGNALYSGASKYLGGNGTSGGQSPGSRQKVLAYLNEKETVIANEAEYQRSVRSPFDITSPYTFMGSLAYSVLPLISSTNIGSILKSTSALTSDSLIALTPAASAIGANEELPPEGTCPLLESSGAVGDAFCNPIVITDTSTIGYSPVAINEVVRGLGGESDTVAAAGIYSKISSSNFDGDGKIKDGSNLAKYITYCGQRVSSYGLRDASILQMSSTAETATTVMSFIPVVGDIAGIVDAGVSAANMKWTTGEQCVATFDPEDSEGWENEYKYYQRYAENERLLENMNPGYKSTVTAYVEKYYDNNPIDNSIEGTLARFSGLSKEEVAGTLALVNYLAHVADYHPEERYAFGEPTIKVEKKLLFDNENQVASESFILLNQISFADVRNRSFAV